MIYLRFEIRSLSNPESPRSDPGMAAFMFEASDPRECTRQAVEILRSEGWRAVALRDAQEGFSLSDFTSREDLGSLFGTAEIHGVAYEVNAPFLTEAAAS